MRFTNATLSGLTLLALLNTSAMADVKLPRLLSDHMVIQRDAKFTVWGWAKPGEKITASIGDNKAQTVAGDDGLFTCQLAPMPANDKPAELVVAGNNTITVRDILVGEVWYCTGQSNMAFVLPRAEHGAEDAAKADYPTLRLASGAQAHATTPQDDINQFSWRPCNPQAAAGFSAVAFYFGRKLNQELKIPIGVIAGGGVPIEVCMPPDAYKTDPTLAEFPAKFAAREAAFAKQKEDWDKTMAAWEAKKKEILATQPAATVGKGIPYPPQAIYPPSQTVGFIYNSLIAPLRRVAIAGVVWYEGESDVGDAAGFSKQMPALIRHWRKNLDQENLTFLWVQLVDNSTQSTANDPNRPCAFSELCNAQTVALALPRTAMVGTLDLSEPGIGHSKFKKPIGDRLAQAALAINYGSKDPNYSSPVLDSLKADGEKLIVKFKYAEGGLVAKSAAGDKVIGFTIAGPDGKFAIADAKIDNDSVILSAPTIKTPVFVRYAWGIMPPYCLFNKAGLPLGIFQAGPIDAAK